jgi:hypothetical protein
VTARMRLALKIVWMAMLVGMLILFGQVDHVFVYQAF